MASKKALAELDKFLTEQKKARDAERSRRREATLVALHSRVVERAEKEDRQYERKNMRQQEKRKKHKPSFTMKADKHRFAGGSRWWTTKLA